MNSSEKIKNKNGVIQGIFNIFEIVNHCIWLKIELIRGLLVREKPLTTKWETI
jgi:hypothetical protein